MRPRGTPWGPRHAVVGIASALVMASCSLVLDADAPQCSTTDDCVARGPAFAASICADSHCAVKPPVTTLSSVVDAGPPEAAADTADPWRCVGHVSWPRPSSEPQVAHETFTTYLGDRPVPGLAVDVCATADIGCTSPLATVTTDAAGAVDLPTTKGFAGYLQVKTAPASFSGLMPTIFPFIVPAGTDPSSPSQLCPSCPRSPSTVTSRGELGALAASVSETLDRTRGMLFTGIRDCDNRVQAGVELELTATDPSAKRFYVEDGLPTAARTTTSPSGEAGFINVRPGLVTVRAKIGSTGRVIAIRTVLVRADTFTAFSLPPTPL